MHLLLCQCVIVQRMLLEQPFAEQIVRSTMDQSWIDLPPWTHAHIQVGEDGETGEVSSSEPRVQLSSPVAATSTHVSAGAGTVSAADWWVDCSTV